MSKSIPSEMRAIELGKYQENLREAIGSLAVVSKPVPRPGRGQALVRIEAAPCNPSDLIFLQGLYGVKKTLPTVPGWEAAGTVIATGGGAFARWLNGKRVACACQADADGTWAEYFVTDAKFCVPLRKDVNLEQGSTLIVNPLTAIAMFERVRREGHSAVVLTAGASQLGRMLLRLALDSDVPIISIVRRKEQGDLLKGLGARFVLNSESENFDATLREECVKLGATIAFDAVAGEMTGRIFNALPPGSTVVVYGGLSYSPCSDIDPLELIFGNKRVEGFWLTNWFLNNGFLHIFRATNQAQRLIAESSFTTTVQKRLRLEKVSEGLMQYQERMTEGKVLILPTLS